VSAERRYLNIQNVLVRVCPVGASPSGCATAFFRRLRRSEKPAQLLRFRIRAALAVRRFRFFCFWFPVVGVRRTTATAPNPARAANSGPRFGGSFVGVQPSIFGPLGRTVERSPACRNHGFPSPGFRFLGLPLYPPHSPHRLTGPHTNRSVSLFYPVRGCEGFPMSPPHSPSQLPPCEGCEGCEPY